MSGGHDEPDGFRDKLKKSFRSKKDKKMVEVNEFQYVDHSRSRSNPVKMKPSNDQMIANLKTDNRAATFDKNVRLQSRPPTNPVTFTDQYTEPLEPGDNNVQ